MSSKVNIDASELGEVASDVSQMKRNLNSDKRDFEKEEAFKMAQEIVASVKRNFDEIRTRRDQTSLMEAFKVDGSPGSQMISTLASDADHARPLEEGKSSHPIPRPPDSPPILSFKPENPAAYVDSDGNSLIREVNDEGYVVLDNVMWKPGARSATGYGYVKEGQQVWANQKEILIEKKLRQSIISAGFKPST